MPYSTFLMLQVNDVNCNPISSETYITSTYITIRKRCCRHLYISTRYNQYCLYSATSWEDTKT